MIAVSDSFKKAIKSDIREIHGYVDVTYDKKEGDYSVDTMPTALELSKSNGIDLIDDVKVMKNYGTLENNYLLLDGSFILANANTLGESGGFISEDIYSNISNPTFNVIAEEDGDVTTKGFTIFFKDNIVFDFNIHIVTEYGSGGTEDTTLDIPVRNNTRYNYLYIFEEETTIKEFQFTIINVEFQDRRIRIPDVNFSLTDVYQNEDLVSFEVNEEIDLLLENLPIDTCTINLNNYPDENGNSKFDPISPTGITQYLTENCTLQPYIGVLTEENGVEYVPMGIFYLKNWSSNNDGNVTLNGEKFMSKLNNITLTSDGSFLKNIDTWYQYLTYIENLINHEVHTNLSDIPVWTNTYLKNTNFINWLLSLSYYMTYYADIYSSEGHGYMVINIDRDNVLQLGRNKSMLMIVDNISRDNLLEDVDYKNKKVISQVSLKTDTVPYIVIIEDEKTVACDVSYTLTKTEEYAWFSLSQPTRYSDAVFTYSGSGNATLIDKNYYMIYVRFRGNIGDTVKITYKGYDFTDNSKKDLLFGNITNDGEKLTFDLLDYYPMDNISCSRIANYYLTHDDKFIITTRTTGDPSLEVGDDIRIQTRYNDEYKRMIITKQKFIYDGGLTCELEGRGD